MTKSEWRNEMVLGHLEIPSSLVIANCSLSVAIVEKMPPCPISLSTSLIPHIIRSMERPIPSPEHRKLEQIAGQWEGEETMHPSPWDPNGGKAIGRIKSRIALGGFALINDYEQVRDGRITFSGHGVFTYDSEEKRIP